MTHIIVGFELWSLIKNNFWNIKSTPSRGFERPYLSSFPTSRWTKQNSPDSSPDERLFRNWYGSRRLWLCKWGHVLNADLEFKNQFNRINTLRSNHVHDYGRSKNHKINILCWKIVVREVKPQLYLSHATTKATKEEEEEGHNRTHKKKRSVALKRSLLKVGKEVWRWID